ncbi:hypothetical protein HDC92_001174 [Pedobacter sp. AK017]|uniref:DUF6904 family protein n=1 Tax=Pedobacter sp. AK017 TaxID=2723073 RepID=UPI001615F8D9|nr:hypothetical protein [Pedobacter sp. AK017]MBB5437502.1 hypothetical protein [Pedobacter sp. AK017]
MLKSCLFENGSGIRLSGELSDLIALHGTVRKIISVVVDYELQATDASNLLVDFLEKIEQAYLGEELVEQYVVQRKPCTHYGFGCSWMEMLMINSLMRSLAEYAVLDELDDINIQLLEYLCRKTLSGIDKADVTGIHHYIGKRFVCLNIRHFIANFSYKDSDFKVGADRDSLKKVQQYLSVYFEESRPLR